MSAWLIVVIFFCFSVALVLVGRKFALKKEYKKREKMELDKILGAFDEAGFIDPIIYNEVVEKLAESIKLDFGLIRPSDKLDDLFGRDSWESGEGQERFENWLLEYAGKLPEFKSVSTVAELVRVIQEYKTGKIYSDH